MSEGQYIYDKDGIKFQKKKVSVWAVLRWILLFFVATVSMAVLYYLIFALVFSTDEEKRLRSENRVYEKEFPSLQAQEDLVAEAVEGLRLKDEKIYEEIFRAPAPNVEPMAAVDFFAGVDSIPDSDIVIYAEKKIDKAEKSARRAGENFERIMEIVQEKGFVMPPMTSPIRDFSFAQTGASTGERISPFYKVKMTHNGLDIIASAGEPVYAAADGIVRNVIKSRKGLGNVVEIDHNNGYVTRYAHLADVEAVKGRKVRKGARIGYVGMSGNSFAPHLHYEVRRDTLVMDPVNYMFASLTPEEYMNVLVMSVITGQSMD